VEYRPSELSSHDAQELVEFRSHTPSPLPQQPAAGRSCAALVLRLLLLLQQQHTLEFELNRLCTHSFVHPLQTFTPHLCKVHEVPPEMRAYILTLFANRRRMLTSSARVIIASDACR
jgi:hypothetical protein